MTRLLFSAPATSATGRGDRQLQLGHGVAVLWVALFLLWLAASLGALAVGGKMLVMPT